MQQKLGATNVAIVQARPGVGEGVLRHRSIKPIADKLGMEVQPFYFDDTTDWTTFAATIAVDRRRRGRASRPPRTPSAWPPSRPSGTPASRADPRLVVRRVRRQAADEQARGHLQPQGVLLPDDQRRIPAKAQQRHRHLDRLHGARRPEPERARVHPARLPRRRPGGRHGAPDRGRDHARDGGGRDAHHQGSDVLPGDGLRLLEELLAAGLRGVLGRGGLHQANKDKVKEILDINPIDTDAVRPAG